jgi:SAM-dependent methyltransferase
MSATKQASAPCCGPTCCNDKSKETAAVTAVVRDQYASTARSSLSSNDAGVRAVAEAFGYSQTELSSIPAEANMGLSCGNPTAMASLRPGETVVDLGCGGGLDVFLAAQQVGPTGRAIGIDMTPEMIERARANAASGNYSNVAFHLATIDRMPLADRSVDCVISNCVINLAPDKSAVFREIFRVLRPGGRLAVSDIALKQPLPDAIRDSVNAYVGCIAGAEMIDDYVRHLRDAGFSDVVVQDSGADLNAYAKIENQAGCCSPAMASSTLPIAGGCCGGASSVHDGLADLLKQHDVNRYAASVKVLAVKPV